MGGRTIYRLKARAVGRDNAVDLFDDLSGEVAATATFTGRAVFANLTIDCGPSGGAWRAGPNRQVMPTTWRVEPLAGAGATVFSRPVGAKLLNPLARELLTVVRESGEGSEIFAVSDARRGGLGRLLNLAASDWALLRDDAIVGAFGRASDPRSAAAARRSGGPLGRARGALARTLGSVAGDRALASIGDEHALRPAEALIALILFAELTQTG